MIRRNKLSNLPMHDDGQQWRVLGCLPQTKKYNLPKFSSVFPVLPQSAWQECNIDISGVPVFNQGQYGSCTGHGSVTAFTAAFNFSGQSANKFSPTSIYARINGGVDRGATVTAALTALEQYGTCFMSQFGEDSIYLSQMSSDAMNTAQRFRVSEAYTVGSVNEVASALMLGLIVVTGLAVGSNFSQLDSNGVCPLPNMVAGGHCLAHYGIKNINGVLVFSTRNSWDTTWGLGGDCYLQQGAWDPRYGFPFDAFAIGDVYTDSGNNTDPPILVT